LFIPRTTRSTLPPVEAQRAGGEALEPPREVQLLHELANVDEYKDPSEPTTTEINPGVFTEIVVDETPDVPIESVTPKCTTILPFEL
jgi:hypothetical protein